jgi:hypothetical protein
VSARRYPARPPVARLPRFGGRSLAQLNALAWFGVAGGPVAWALQYIIGAQLGLARCDSPDARFALPTTAWSIGLAAAAAVVAVLAELASIAVFRATRETRNDDALQAPRPEGLKGGVAGDPPAVSAGRLRFLGVVGITVNPLAFAICVMVVVATPLLGVCHQS